MPAGPHPDDALSSIVDMLREASRQTDPEAFVRIYRARVDKLIKVDRTVSLSRRDLQPPNYRITRSDIWTRQINPWKQTQLLPVFQRGLLGQLLYAGEARLIDSLQIAPDDPAVEHFQGMGSLAAIPHFDGGQALNMVIHMWRQSAAFDSRRFPELVLLSGIFGRAMRGLVLTTELRDAQEKLQAQYRVMTELSDTVLEQARGLSTHAQLLEEKVRLRTAELESAHLDAIRMLAIASEEKDLDTGEHLHRIQDLTYQTAVALGVPDPDARAMSRAAILHDVGKMHIPDQILQKPGPLTTEERQVMQTHTLSGERILAHGDYFGSARAVARSHHENWDGTGYPDGLRDDHIPLEARIVHVVDVYDALTNARPYKRAWPRDKALAFLSEQTGKMFEPRAVDAFLRLQPAMQGSESPG